MTSLHERTSKECKKFDWGGIFHFFAIHSTKTYYMAIFAIFGTLMAYIYQKK